MKNKGRSKINKTMHKYFSSDVSWNRPHIEIILTHGKTALFDVEDYQKIKANGPWRCYKNGNRFYAAGRDWKMETHRLIMGFPKYPEFVVDHKNGDGLDNRRKNLRIVTQAENRKNTIRHRAKHGIPE